MTAPSLGVLFLLGDTVGLAMIVRGFASIEHSAATPTQAAPIGAGVITLCVSRLWEIANIFGAVNRAEMSGTVAAATPTIDINIQRASLKLGISVKY